MASKELVAKYDELYKRIQGLTEDREIYPSSDTFDLKRFVSQRKWFGVPSFGIKTKEELTKTPHITFRIKDGKILADLFFNGRSGVEKFKRILYSIPEESRNYFLESLKSVDGQYNIQLQYRKYRNGPLEDWKLFKKIDSNNLTDQPIENLINWIKDLQNLAELSKKQSPNQKQTISIVLSRSEINNDNDENLKKILTNLSDLTKSLSDVNKDIRWKHISIRKKV